MKFAAILLLMVYLTHYGVGELATLYPSPAAAEKALFYVAQGLKGCALWVVVAALAPRRIWSAPLWAVCLWGFAEDFEVAACRLALGIQNVPQLVNWRGVCEVVTQRSLYVSGLVVFSALAVSAVGYGASRGKD
jgi:hypothetical protein